MSDDRFQPDFGGEGLAEGSDAGLGTQVDVSDAQAFGRYFIGSVYKILKVGSIYSVEHNQTRQAIAEFMPIFRESVSRTEQRAISIGIRGELVRVNGETLRLKRREQERLNELHDLFAAANIRGIAFEEPMTVDHLVAFLMALNEAARVKSGMEHVNIPHVLITHGSPDQSILEAIAEVNKAMYVAHVYIRGLVKVRNMHEHVRDSQNPDVPTGVVRRIMQTVSELLTDDDFTILGLLPLRLVPPDAASHSVNTAIYGMLLADRLGLNPQVATYLGMAVIYQDIDRLVGITVGHRDRDPGLDPQRQYSANLRDVARMLGHVDGDTVSTLRILMTYERGCPYEAKVGRPFYRSPRDLHLITRIIDIARTYDLLIQGLQGYKSRRPDLAIQYIESRAGEIFDPPLVKLMVSTLGIFPIGTTVQLTSGEKAVVIRTPAPSSDPRRPVVRLLNRNEPMVVDLSDRRYANIEIARSIELEESDVAPSQIFLLT
jgi:HD-GYP domain-containing protein (c-di-GMP phosphodiesterase class II)